MEDTLMGSNIAEKFFCSPQKIDIPEQFRTIIVRSNFAKLSPFQKTKTPTIWPESGSVSSTGKRGLFGILLSQDLVYFDLVCFICPLPKFMILEVDQREISTKGLQPNVEVEFRNCNVLFNGYIHDFLERIKEFATADQWENINNTLAWKAIEFDEAKSDPLLLTAYIIQVGLRAQEVGSSKNSFLRMKQILSEIKTGQIKAKCL